MIARFPVEEGHVQMFAEAIGDPNPDYRRPVKPGVKPSVAPPTFVMASAHFDPDYPLRPRLGQPWHGSGSTPTGRQPGPVPPEMGERGGLGPALHAEQHFEFERPVVVGDVLHAESRPGASWTKQGRSGVLHFSESIVKYLDELDRLVVTARTVTVQREAPAP